jgi:signal transduction histidine kinase
MWTMEDPDADEGGGETGDPGAALFRAVSDPVIGYALADATPVVRAANPAFGDVFDGAPVGRPLADGLVGGDDALAERIGDGERVDVVVPAESGGDDRHFRCRSVPTPEPETPLDGYVVYTDVTERERERRALSARADRAESFAKIVSHDLRNPIDVAEIRMQAARDSGEPVHFEKAIGAVRRMNRIIESVRSMTLEAEGVDAVALDLDAAVRDAWDAVDTGGATLAVGDLGGVRADPDHLRQLFENLFRNSVEHGSTDSRPQADDAVEHGSTSSRTESDDSVEHGSTDSRPQTDDAVEHGSTSSRAEPGDSVEHGSTGSRPQADDAVEHETDGRSPDDRDAAGLTVRVGPLDAGFYVEDDGVGIPAAERDRIFEPRYSTADDGTGYGLAIVKRIAEAHGWRVALAASDAGGARFEFTGVESAPVD